MFFTGTQNHFVGVLYSRKSIGASDCQNEDSEYHVNHTVLTSREVEQYQVICTSLLSYRSVGY